MKPNSQGMVTTKKQRLLSLRKTFKILGANLLSPELPCYQERVELSTEDKEGAIDTFFTKVRGELDIIPLKVRVKEILQEKAVFPDTNEIS